MVGEVTLREARDRLIDAMRHLPELAVDLEAPELVVTEYITEAEPGSVQSAMVRASLGEKRL